MGGGNEIRKGGKISVKVVLMSLLMLWAVGAHLYSEESSEDSQRTVIFKVLSLDQQPQHHLELIRKTVSWIPPQIY